MPLTLTLPNRTLWSITPCLALSKSKRSKTILRRLASIPSLDRAVQPWMTESFHSRSSSGYCYCLPDHWTCCTVVPFSVSLTSCGILSSISIFSSTTSMPVSSIPSWSVMARGFAGSEGVAWRCALYGAFDNSADCMRVLPLCALGNTRWRRHDAAPALSRLVGLGAPVVQRVALPASAPGCCVW